MQRLNHAAVVLAVIAHQVLGYLWYSVLPFAGLRLEALGQPVTNMRRVDPSALLSDIVGWILASYIIALLIRQTNTKTAANGALLGLLLWMGIAVPTLVPHYAFAEIKPLVTVIDSLNVLIALVVSGAIIAGWKMQPAARSA